MQTRILCALIALAMAGTAAAQAVQPAPGAGATPPPAGAGLPPLPPGCAGNNGALPPPPSRPPMSAANDGGLVKGLGISGAQASRVQKVFEHQRAQAERLEQQRRDLDAQTCKDLRSILGDQGMARWSAAAPTPPPGGPGSPGPGREPGGTPPPPPPPPPPQGN